MIRGKDGWLFAGNEANDILRQQSGELPLTSQQLDEWQRLLEARVDWLAGIGVPYLYLIAPEAHSVYPEKLPDGCVSSPDRPALQLQRHLAERHSRVRLVHPIEELQREKQRNPVYSQTDSHWNDRAAFVAYQALTDEIEQLLPFKRLHEDDLDWTIEERPGQLGNELDPPLSSEQVFGWVRDSHVHLVSDNRVRNRGAIVVLECDRAPDTSCVVLGDSMSYNTMFYLAEGFRRLVFAHIAAHDYELIRAERPDIVIGERAERLLTNVPVDVPAWSTRQWAEHKTARGQVFPERGGWGLSLAHRRKIYQRQALASRPPA